MKQEKKRVPRLLKGINTVDELLNIDELYSFVEHLNKEIIPNVEQIAVIYVNKEGQFGLGNYGFDIPELLGALELSKHRVMRDFDKEESEEDI